MFGSTCLGSRPLLAGMASLPTPYQPTKVWLGSLLKGVQYFRVPPVLARLEIHGCMHVKVFKSKSISGNTCAFIIFDSEEQAEYAIKCLHGLMVPDLSGDMFLKVATGSALATFAIQVFTAFGLCQFPFCIMNPKRSWLWKLPVWEAASAIGQSNITLDQCRFGMPFLGSTRLRLSVPSFDDTQLCRKDHQHGNQKQNSSTQLPWPLARFVARLTLASIPHSLALFESNAE